MPARDDIDRISQAQSRLAARSDRAARADAGTVWSAFVAHTTTPGWPKDKTRSAVLSNLVSLVLLGDAEDIVTLDSLIRSFGAERVATIQSELDDMLGLGPDLPVTTAALRILGDVALVRERRRERDVADEGDGHGQASPPPDVLAAARRRRGPAADPDDPNVRATGRPARARHRPALAGRAAALDREVASDGTGTALWVDQHHRWLQLYTADDTATPRVSIAVEPMTAPPDAFNSGDDLTLIEPAATFSASWGIFAIPGSGETARAAGSSGDLTGSVRRRATRRRPRRHPGR